MKLAIIERFISRQLAVPEFSVNAIKRRYVLVRQLYIQFETDTTISKEGTLKVEAERNVRTWTWEARKCALCGASAHRTKECQVEALLKLTPPLTTQKRLPAPTKAEEPPLLSLKVSRSL